MAEILHFEILRKHGQTNTHTNTKTDRHGHYNTSPSPYGGRGKYCRESECTINCHIYNVLLTYIRTFKVLDAYHQTSSSGDTIINPKNKVQTYAV